jgi:hypothetical protein
MQAKAMPNSLMHNVFAFFTTGGGHWGVFNTVIPQANFVNNRSFESKIANTVYHKISNIVIPQFFKENTEIP